MVKPLSAQLADLSVRAKSAEDAVAAAQKEAHDKVVARTGQAHAAATAALQKMDQDIKSANNDIRPLECAESESFRRYGRLE